MDLEEIRQWDEDTMAMIKDPRPGDHFTEHLGSQLYVVRRFPGWVAVRRPDRVANKWGPLKLMSMNAMRKLLCYETMPDKPIVEGWRKGIYPRFQAKTKGDVT